MSGHLTAYASNAEGSWFHVAELPPDALTGDGAEELQQARATYPEVAVFDGAREVARFVQPPAEVVSDEWLVASNDPPAPTTIHQPLVTDPPRRRKRRRGRKRPRPAEVTT